MVGALITVGALLFFQILGASWYLSSRMTSQDIRLRLIERHLKLNGYARKGGD
jgi:hypothetical protein